MADPVLIAISFCMGIAFSTMLAMLGSLAPDALDIDRSLTGQRREASSPASSIWFCSSRSALGIVFDRLDTAAHRLSRRETPTSEVVLVLRVSTAVFPVILSIWAALLMRNRNTFVGDQSISGG